MASDLGYWLMVVGLTASFLGMRAVHPSISEYIGEAGGWVTLLALVPLTAAVWVSPLLKSKLSWSVLFWLGSFLLALPVAGILFIVLGSVVPVQ